MLVSFGGEGSNFYGEPLLENVREVWNDWRKANEMAARYDRKIAGAYLLLHYPSFGQGIDQNGAKLDNVYLAQRILDKLEAASGVAIGDVPSELAPGQDPLSGIDSPHRLPHRGGVACDWKRPWRMVSLRKATRARRARTIG